MTEFNEQSLISKSKQGDLQAFDELIRRHQDQIFNTTYCLVTNHQDAADICQETFIRAYQHISKFREQSTFHTWIYQIAINVWHNYHRDHKKLSPLADNDLLENKASSANPIIPLQQAEQTSIIQQAINSLADDLKTVVILKDIDGHSYEEISKILQCSIGSIRKKLTKTRSILKEALKKYL